ncbi:MAG: lytic transglycosylase domain-containing protein [Nitrospinae bacterium]|jgi:soluble lytic murein transglycosylase-like protein|nr:lytic transglycosylase domain-containing protein [Nitrospinota bacterium]MDA1109122.1 lytic transglycosylase domain-containing protein [Nitrospinota bacterium]
MFKSNQIKYLFPLLSVSLFTLVLMGQTSQPIHGLSPYHSAAIQFEETVFVKILDLAKRKEVKEKAAQVSFQQSYDRKIKEKIRKVISEYQRRMDPQHFEEIPGMILAESKIYGYDPMFVTALIITESSFDNKARSNRGAMGLMQILPRTGVALASEKEMEWKGSPTLYNPEINIALGTYYLNKLENRFGDLNLALEAYNHGPTRLDKYLKRGYQPKRYSKKVFQIYEMIDFELS